MRWCAFNKLPTCIHCEWVCDGFRDIKAQTYQPVKVTRHRRSRDHSTRSVRFHMMMMMMMMDELQSCHKVQGTARTRNSKMCHAVMSEQWKHIDGVLLPFIYLLRLYRDMLVFTSNITPRMHSAVHTNDGLMWWRQYGETSFKLWTAIVRRQTTLLEKCWKCITEVVIWGKWGKNNGNAYWILIPNERILCYRLQMSVSSFVKIGLKLQPWERGQTHRHTDRDDTDDLTIILSHAVP